MKRSVCFWEHQQLHEVFCVVTQNYQYLQCCFLFFNWQLGLIIIVELVVLT